MTVRAATLEEVRERLGDPDLEPGRGWLALIDDADATSVMVAQKAYTFEANPPDEALRYYVISHFNPTAVNLRAMIREMIGLLRAQGDGATPVRWRVEGNPTLEVLVDRILEPRERTNESGKVGRELTPDEGEPKVRDAR